ncbi:unnamed protein product [Pleuronectes platessa]|uniref:Uncharacterized protein n=1 Tax=Pleuronectes platessa TaxID=8262 RepID=A0A9N7Z5X6_PLEPL|nr:unnamed protein product [Pleuronectes platessa]
MPRRECVVAPLHSELFQHIISGSFIRWLEESVGVGLCVRMDGADEEERRGKASGVCTLGLIDSSLTPPLVLQALRQITPRCFFSLSPTPDWSSPRISRNSILRLHSTSQTLAPDEDNTRITLLSGSACRSHHPRLSVRRVGGTSEVEQMLVRLTFAATPRAP